MPIYALGELVPSIDETAYVHPDAVLIGDVRLGPEASVWPGAVLRADGAAITIGARTSVQDGSVLHVTPIHPTTVGEECVIGHLVHLEGCTIASGAQVSSGAVVLHRAIVGGGAVVAANAVVLDDTEVPAGALAVGAPARFKVGRARPDDIARAVAIYVDKAARFRRELRRIG